MAEYSGIKFTFYLYDFENETFHGIPESEMGYQDFMEDSLSKAKYRFEQNTLGEEYPYCLKDEGLFRFLDVNKILGSVSRL